MEMCRLYLALSWLTSRDRKPGEYLKRKTQDSRWGQQMAKCCQIPVWPDSIKYLSYDNRSFCGHSKGLKTKQI